MKTFLQQIKVVSTILFLIAHLQSLAQNPVHYTIGENELQNVDVYSILEAKSEKLYLSSNVGIFVYSKELFRKILGDSTYVQSSLFGLIENEKNEIFCYNLAGQIFTIKNNILNLYCTIPEKFVSNRMQLILNKKNELIYFSKGNCLKISDKNKFEILSTQYESSGSEISKLANGKTLTSTNSLTEYFELVDGKFKLHNYKNKIPFNPNNYFKSFFLLENQLVISSRDIVGLANGETYKKMTNSLTNRFFSIENNEVWVLNRKKGVSAFSLKNGKTIVSKTYFKEFFISTCHKGKSNNIYLGTFGEGIIVIPNRKMMEHNIQQKGNKIQDFAVSQNNDVFISSIGDGIIHYKTQPKTLVPEKKEHFDLIFWKKGADFKKNKKFKGLYFSDKTLEDNNKFSLPTVKCIELIDEKTFLLGTSKELFKVGSGKVLNNNYWTKRNELNVAHSLNVKSRTHALAFDKQKHQLFVATLNGTFVFSKQKPKAILTYKKSKIICQDMVFHDQKLWCATQKHGILVFRDKKVVAQYKFHNSIEKNQIQQIIIQNDFLYALNNGEVIRVNINTGETLVIGKLYGVFGTVNKFQLSADKIWFLIDKTRILSVLLTDITKKKEQLNIYIDSVKVLDKSISIHSSPLSYKENSLTFFANVRNIRLDELAKIKYRIKGFEEHWNTKSSNFHPIEYKYLPPGEYTFEVYAKYGGQSSAKKTYSFIITRPFWQRWWFYLSIVLLITVSAYLIFKKRIQVIRKKNAEKLEKEQLKANFVEAELRALRSQMNPHFIFNALHSIQALVLSDETENSYDYIVLFSKLVRKTLNYSNEEFIQLDSEIEFIDVYLKLEKLRFGDSFNYTITNNCKSDVLVPSLLIQPFIENALVHGLQHLTTSKNLSISFTKTNQLVCTIIDNGIGREASKEIKDRQGNKHKSFALKSIEKRLKIYQSEFGDEIGFTITDLTDGINSKGTKVEITIPFKNRF